MKIRENYIIKSNKEIANNIYEIILKGNTKAITQPGEFVNVMIPGLFLPRPISVCYSDQENLYLVYKVVGEGTEVLSKMVPNETLTILTGLGNGFDINNDSKKPLLIGGGVGVAPLYKLAVELEKRNRNATVIMGFKNREEEFYYEKFKKIFKTYITFEQDSINQDEKLVTDVLKKLPIDDYDYFYACGPKPMLKSVCDIVPIDGEVSLESRMACGIGQCKCCSIETNDGMKTLCKDGPVLKKNLVRW